MFSTVAFDASKRKVYATGIRNSVGYDLLDRRAIKKLKAYQTGKRANKVVAMIAKIIFDQDTGDQAAGNAPIELTASEK